MVEVSKTQYIYAAEPQVKHLGQVLRDMLRGVANSWYLAYRLAIKDVKADYSKSVFGMGWDFVDPLVYGAVFYFLMHGRIIDPGAINMPYVLFVMYGLLLYMSFSEALLSSVRLFERSRGLLNHVKFAPEALIMSGFCYVVFKSSFRIAAMFLLSIVLGSYSIVGFLKFLACFPLFLLCPMAIGVFLAPFNAIYRDVDRLVTVTLFPLRFISPVLWLLPMTGFFGVLYDLNPVAVYIMNLRALAIHNTFFSVGPLIAVCCNGYPVYSGMVHISRVDPCLGGEGVTWNRWSSSKASLSGIRAAPRNICPMVFAICCGNSSAARRRTRCAKTSFGR